MKYEFLQINNFVANHTGEEFFEADKKLYKKLFPESKILKDLDNAQPFQKKNLDERMVLEILQADRICFETVWEYRGVIKTVNPEKPNIENKAPVFEVDKALQKTIDELLNTDLKAAKYNVLKGLVFGLDLQTHCADNKRETYIAVLTDAVAMLTPAPVENDTTTEAPTMEGTTVDDKKKEDPEQSTQQ